MNDPHDPWARPFFTPGGGDAFLLYYVFGRFDGDLSPPRARYHIEGDISWLKVSKHESSHPRVREVLAQPLFSAAFDREGELGALVREAPHCLLVHGEVHDPERLDYLRDACGLVAFLLDHGATGALDAFRLKLWSRDAFDRAIFSTGRPAELEQTTLLRTEEPGGKHLWLHTRGMRKVGRPDISVRHVPIDLEPRITHLVTTYVQALTLGLVVGEGDPVKLPSLAHMTCHPGGSLDDPDFHNVHLDVRFPAV